MVYVLQGEAAVVGGGPGPRRAGPAGGGPRGAAGAGPPPLVGSAEATTCVIAAFRCPASGCTALAHLDTSFSGAQLEALLEGAFEAPEVAGASGGGGQGPALEAYLLGGFRDPAGQGPALARAVLAALGASPRRFRLALCCVGEHNTEGGHAGGGSAQAPGGAGGGAGGGGRGPRPRFAGLAVDPASGQAYALEGARPGPESRAPFLPRRHAALWLASLGVGKLPSGGGGSGFQSLRTVFTSGGQASGGAPPSPPSSSGRFRLPAETHLVSQCAVARVRALLQRPPGEVLACCSTSPEQEGPDFLPQLRAAFDFILRHALPCGGEGLLCVHLPREELSFAEWRASICRAELRAELPALKTVRSAPRLSDERERAPMAC